MWCLETTEIYSLIVLEQNQELVVLSPKALREKPSLPLFSLWWLQTFLDCGWVTPVAASMFTWYSLFIMFSPFLLFKKMNYLFERLRNVERSYM